MRNRSPEPRARARGHRQHHDHRSARTASVKPELGIIEEFYGKPCTWDARKETVSFLARYGYRFYLYAPKADPYLRRRWQEPYPDDVAEKLKSFASHCRDTGVRFGIGLSPYELYT